MNHNKFIIHNGHDNNNTDTITSNLSLTWLSIASLANLLGDLDQTINAYHMSLYYNPSCLTSLIYFGNFYLSKMMFQHAILYYQNALIIDNKLFDVWLNIGNCYFFINDLSNSFKSYQKALQLLDDPNNSKLWYYIGILYTKLNSFEFAKKSFLRVININPIFDKNFDIYLKLAQIYKFEKNYYISIDYFKKIINLNYSSSNYDNSMIYFQIGKNYYQLNDFINSRKYFEKSIIINPNFFITLLQLGHLYDNFFNNPIKSINYLLRAININSNYSITWYLLAKAQLNSEKFIDSFNSFQKAIIRDPFQPIFWCSLGILYFKIGQFNDTLDAYTRSIRHNPFISETWYNLGILYESLENINNHFDNAIFAYKKSIILNSKQALAIDRLNFLKRKFKNKGKSSIKLTSSNNNLTPIHPNIDSILNDLDDMVDNIKPII